MLAQPFLCRTRAPCVLRRAEILLKPDKRLNLPPLTQGPSGWPIMKTPRVCIRLIPEVALVLVVTVLPRATLATPVLVHKLFPATHSIPPQPHVFVHHSVASPSQTNRDVELSESNAGVITRLKGLTSIGRRLHNLRLPDDLMGPGDRPGISALVIDAWQNDVRHVSWHRGM
jgi:hypothetical protein